MPTELRKWECDICSAEYGTLKEARACEALGWPEVKAGIGETIGYLVKMPTMIYREEGVVLGGIVMVIIP